MRQPERAVVAVVRVDFRLQASRSLKDKRSVIKSFREKAQGRFGVASCESGYLEDAGMASLTLAALAGRESAARDRLRTAVAFLEDHYEVEVFAAVEEVY
ncbi:MAG: DUF503 domain-containing protein [Acidobacteriota bacterium]